MRWAVLVAGVVIGAVFVFVPNEVRPEPFGTMQVTGAPDIMDLTLTDLGPDFDDIEPDPSGLFSSLRPGEYQLVGRIPVNGDDAREFGFVTIVAGQRIQFEVKLPTGALEIELYAQGKFERIETLCVELEADRKDQSPSGLRVWLPPVAREDGSTIWKKRIVALGHGTYRLKLRHRRLKTVERLVTIGPDVETLRFELEPK